MRMRHQHFCLPLICLSLVWLAIWTRPVAAQTPSVRVLDADNVGLTALVDGNSISLQLNLPQAVNADTGIDFLLDGVATPIASCTIPTAQTSCQTAPFPTLGWAWGADGVRPKQRVITAQAADMAVGESAPIAITPRPVVMVHGFKASWKGWSAYLGADGYLAAMGVAGYAVGDGQVPGAMDIGDLATALARTNTIAQNGAILGEYIRNVQQLTGAERPTAIYCCGPEPMMHAVSRLAAQHSVPCWLSLETPMACGFGACFSCVTRVKLPEGGWDYRRTCIEGPIFPADQLWM